MVPSPPNNESAFDVEKITQVEKVCALFAGITVGKETYVSGIGGLAAALRAVGAGYTRATIYKWTWPPERSGTGGIIPTRAIPHIEKAARHFGILIPQGCLDPRGQKIRVRKSDPNTKTKTRVFK